MRLTGTPYPAALPWSGAATLVEGGQLHPQGPDHRQRPSASPTPQGIHSALPGGYYYQTGIALTSEVMTAIILNFTGEEIEPEAKSLAWEHCIQTGRMSSEAASSSQRGDSLQCPDKTGACPPEPAFLWESQGQWEDWPAPHGQLQS